MFIRTLQLLSIVCLGLIVGCAPSETTDNNGTANNQSNETNGEHADPHDVPMTDAEIEKLRADNETWAVAIKSVEEYRNTIKTETTGGEPAKAHRALDELDYVLKWLPEIAQNSNVPKDDLESIVVNSENLIDYFDAVHTNIDDDKAPDYEAVAALIDTAVEALVAIKAGEATATDPPE